MSVVAFAAAISALVMGIVVVQRYDALPAPTPNYTDTATCCRYSHRDLPATIASLRTFTRDTLRGNCKFAHDTGDWDDFTSVLPDLETAIDDNDYLQELMTLRAKLRSIMATNGDSLEDIVLQPYVNELDLLLNLSAIDAYYMHTAIAYWDTGKFEDPISLAADVIALLPLFVDEEDFVERVQAWLSNLSAKLTRFTALGARSLEANHTHTTYTLVRQSSLPNGYGYTSAFAANYTQFCLDTMEDDDLTACLVYAEEIEEKLSDYADWFTGDYTDACDELRPDETPGLRNVTDGDTIDDIWKLYGLGTLPDDDVLYNLGEAGFQAMLEHYDDVAPDVDDSFVDSDDLLFAFGDPDNDVLYLCTNDTNDAIDVALLDLARVSHLIPAGVGFGPRTLGATSVTVHADDIRTYYRSGLYNGSNHYWTSSAVFNLAQLGDCTGSSTKYYDTAGLRAAVVREAMLGYALQQSLNLELDCSFQDGIPSTAASVNGWATFAEFLGLELGLYADSNVSLAGYYRSQGLADNRLREDRCVHSSTLNSTVGGCDVDAAIDLHQSVGYSADEAAYELASILLMPAQALSYRYGAKLLVDLRTNLTDDLSDANITLDSRDFVHLFLRFGGPDVVRHFVPLVSTYAKIAWGNATTSADFGRDLIPTRLFGSGTPVVGARGRLDTCEAAADLMLVQGGRES